jgi:hypothetical protein
MRLLFPTNPCRLNGLYCERSDGITGLIHRIGSVPIGGPLG